MDLSWNDRHCTLSTSFRESYVWPPFRVPEISRRICHCPCSDVLRNNRTVRSQDRPCANRIYRSQRLIDSTFPSLLPLGKNDLTVSSWSITQALPACAHAIHGTSSRPEHWNVVSDRGTISAKHGLYTSASYFLHQRHLFITLPRR
jgi:hypothetical protein